MLMIWGYYLMTPRKIYKHNTVKAVSVFRPNLAVALDTSQVCRIQYPVYVSNKVDGVRCTVRDGVCVSRSNKPIPNKHVQALFSQYEGLDGELIVGPYDSTVFRRTTSGVMTIEGTPNVQLWVFDVVLPNLTYTDRLKVLKDNFRRYRYRGVVLLDQTLIHQQLEVDHVESIALQNGYEGLILRNPNALYKHGRSTMTDQGIMKLKRFLDDEAVITGYFEEMENLNEAITDERGYTKRSTHQDNLHGKGVLGGVIVLFNSVEQRIGTGFTVAERTELWADRGNLIGRLAKFKYFSHGSYNKLRHGVWLGLRHTDDT